MHPMHSSHSAEPTLFRTPSLLSSVRPHLCGSTVKLLLLSLLPSVSSLLPSSSISFTESSSSREFSVFSPPPLLSIFRGEAEEEGRWPGGIGLGWREEEDMGGGESRKLSPGKGEKGAARGDVSCVFSKQRKNKAICPRIAGNGCVRCQRGSVIQGHPPLRSGRYIVKGGGGLGM